MVWGEILDDFKQRRDVDAERGEQMEVLRLKAAGAVFDRVEHNVSILRTRLRLPISVVLSTTRTESEMTVTFAERRKGLRAYWFGLGHACYGSNVLYREDNNSAVNIVAEYQSPILQPGGEAELDDALGRIMRPLIEAVAQASGIGG